VKDLQGRASGEVAVPLEDCFALIAAVDRYPTWFDVVREVEVLERDRDGRPLTARVELHIPQSPFGTDFELVVAVETEAPVAVMLTKIPDGPHDQERAQLSWRMQDGEATQVEFEFDAAVSFLPAFLPLRGIGDVVAEVMLDAATDAFARR
jgi:ribosome-associated toxin RatA of RatAB toxin-antitoxin module